MIGSISTSSCEQLASTTLPNATVTAARGYPAVAHYKGAGSIDDAANFSCAARDRQH